jgi:hypothetical protein
MIFLAGLRERRERNPQSKGKNETREYTPTLHAGLLWCSSELSDTSNTSQVPNFLMVRDELGIFGVME